jgi:hypothetical protein
MPVAEIDALVENLKTKWKVQRIAPDIAQESLRSAKMSFCYCVHCEQPSKARSSTAISCELRALLHVVWTQPDKRPYEKTQSGMDIFIPDFR